MAPGLFKSRRSPTSTDETAKVVDAVWAYYKAGHRPSTTHLAPPPISTLAASTPAASTPAALAPHVSAVSEPPAPLAAAEPELISHQAENGLDEPAVTANGQSLSQLADELEALIESIRYADLMTPGDAS